MKNINAQYIETAGQPADCLTKSLAPRNHERCTRKMNVVSIKTLLVIMLALLMQISMMFALPDIARNETILTLSLFNRAEKKQYVAREQQIYKVQLYVVNPCEQIADTFNGKLDNASYPTADRMYTACVDLYQRLRKTWSRLAHSSFPVSSGLTVNSEGPVELKNSRGKREITLLGKAITSGITAVIGLSAGIVHASSWTTEIANFTEVKQYTNDDLQDLRYRLREFSTNIMNRLRYYEEDAQMSAVLMEANMLLIEQIMNATAVVEDWENGKISQRLIDHIGVKWPRDRPPSLCKPIKAA